MAYLLAAVVSMGLTVNLETRVLADVTVIKEEPGEVDINWKISQSLNVTSCQQGDTITLTVQAGGDVDSDQISSIYGRLQYDQEIFKVAATDITPYKLETIDYISFDEDSGEVEVSYAKNISFQNGTPILKIKLHVLSDAKGGATKVGINAFELYDESRGDFVAMENPKTIKVTIDGEEDAGVKLGDVNQDKKINLTDVKLIIKYCNGETKLTVTQKKNADVNKDGKVNLTDAKLVMKSCNAKNIEERKSEAKISQNQLCIPVGTLTSKSEWQTFTFRTFTDHPEKLKVKKAVKGAEYVFSSSNEKIVTIPKKGGYPTGVKQGKAKITCTEIKDGKKSKIGTCTVYVKAAYIDVAIGAEGCIGGIGSYDADIAESNLGILYARPDATYSFTTNSPNLKLTWKRDKERSFIYHVDAKKAGTYEVTAWEEYKGKKNKMETFQLIVSSQKQNG